MIMMITTEVMMITTKVTMIIIIQLAVRVNSMVQDASVTFAIN
jgi:hypothetical protein